MAEASGKAVKRSVLRTIGFSILSPIYGFYWFYQTRKAVTAELKANDNVGGQTFGLIVPILNLFIIYWLYRDVDKLHRKGGGAGFNPLVYLLVPIVISIIPVIGLVGGLIGLILFGLVVSKLNEYWDTQGATGAPVTKGEIAAVVVGIVLWVLYAIAMVAIIGDASDANDQINNIQYNY